VKSVTQLLEGLVKRVSFNLAVFSVSHYSVCGYVRPNFKMQTQMQLSLMHCTVVHCN